MKYAVNRNTLDYLYALEIMYFYVQNLDFLRHRPQGSRCNYRASILCKLSLNIQVSLCVIWL